MAGTHYLNYTASLGLETLSVPWTTEINSLKALK